MTIMLRIDNCDALPDGGPLFYSSNRSGFDFGRDTHLDWTLPDESRYISGRHCEIRFEQGQYLLYDISRNGTFLNGSQDRVKSPYQLQNGDKIVVGHYVIVVTLSGVATEAQFEDDVGGNVQQHAAESEDIWSMGGDIPAPISRRDLMPPKQQGRRDADFSEQFLDIPQMRVDKNFQAATGAAKPFDTPAIQPIPKSENRFAEGSPFPPGSAGAPFAAPGAAQPSPLPVTPPAAAPGGGLPNVAAYPEFAPLPPAQGAAQGVEQARGDANLLHQIAAGAGVPVEVFGQGNPADMAHEIGSVLRVAVDQMAQLLKARAAAKTMSKSSKRTMISASDNNPLKFVPTTDEMFDVMFARRKAGYMGARQSFENGFEDLKAHEFATYSAMQQALARLLEDFSPESIEKKLPSSAFSSKSGKAWEAYVARWEAMSEPHENGVLDVFLSYFADAYDAASKSTKND